MPPTFMEKWYESAGAFERNGKFEYTPKRQRAAAVHALAEPRRVGTVRVYWCSFVVSRCREKSAREFRLQSRSNQRKTFATP